MRSEQKAGARLARQVSSLNHPPGLKAIKQCLHPVSVGKHAGPVSGRGDVAHVELPRLLSIQGILGARLAHPVAAVGGLEAGGQEQPHHVANARVAGIDDDYPLVKGNNRDGYQNLLISKISTSIGNYYLPFVDIKVHNLLGKDLCQVDVSPSDKPAYLTNKGNQEFYVRTGNNSRPFKVSEVAQYVAKHWA